MAAKKKTLIVLEPKNDKAREKLGYHGSSWYFRGIEEKLKFARFKGKCLAAISRDGSKVIYISEENDPDFEYRIVQ